MNRLMSNFAKGDYVASNKIALTSLDWMSAVHDPVVVKYRTGPVVFFHFHIFTDFFAFSGSISKMF